MQTLRSCKKSCAGTRLQVMKQQEVQRRAAEEARERVNRRGRDSVYDFRFTRFHDTGLEQQIVPELPNNNPSLADSTEMRTRLAALTAHQLCWDATAAEFLMQ